MHAVATLKFKKYHALSTFFSQFLDWKACKTGTSKIKAYGSSKSLKPNSHKVFHPSRAMLAGVFRLDSLSPAALVAQLVGLLLSTII